MSDQPDTLAAALSESETAHPHPEFPHYLVTSHGRVWSIRSGRFLKPVRMGQYQGSMITHISGLIVKRYIHRLVLEAVVGPCPAGMQARHLNGDRHDNRASNLAWGTPKQNNADKQQHGTVLHGSKNPMAKLTEDQVREIRAMVQSGARQREACRWFGVSPMAVSRIIRGEAWIGSSK